MTAIEMKQLARPSRLVLRRALGIACLTLALATWGGSVQAQAKAVPKSATELQLSFAPLVKRVAPAVVNIYTKTVVREPVRSPLFDDPFFKRFFGDSFPGVPRQRQHTQTSLGSGVLVDSTGLVVTNHHVIEKADEIIVVLADRREFTAQLVLDDQRTDLAVLKVGAEGDKFPALDLRNSDELEVGDLVLAIGNPFGVGQTVTSGIVSALARTRVGVSDYQFFIQTDAAINPGNSGGALVSMDGRLVGVNTAIYSRSGGSIGIGFAIPANLVAAVLETAKAGGKLVRPWLGASGQPVTADVAQGLGLDRPGGVVISSIYQGGPAEQAGLSIGDVIVAVDGHEVLDTRALRFRIATKPLGTQAILTVIRNGKSRKLPINLIAAPEDPPRHITELRGSHPFSGALVGNLSPAFAEELGLDTLISGVIVLKTRPGSPAERLRLRPGDIFVRANGVEIKSVLQLQKVLRGMRAPFRVGLQRHGKVYNLVIGG